MTFSVDFPGKSVQIQQREEIRIRGCRFYFVTVCEDIAVLL